jgi:hypothetical protein
MEKSSNTGINQVVVAICTVIVTAFGSFQTITSHMDATIETKSNAIRNEILIQVAKGTAASIQHADSLHQDQVRRMSLMEIELMRAGKKNRGPLKF